MVSHGAASFAILCGGRGRRLGGADKSSIRVDGTSCRERLAALGASFGELLWVGPTQAPQGARAVSDVVQGRGSPGAVHAALAASRFPWVLAVGCDMPFVSGAATDVLLAHAGDAWDAVCFEVGGRLEPLLALYRSAVEPAWRAALAREPAFRDVFSGLRARVLPQSELQAVDPELRSVVSLNTPEDLARWAAVLPSER
jgi:molybdopterin-guanine dinucleotide biosynthesis protein A